MIFGTFFWLVATVPIVARGLSWELSFADHFEGDALNTTSWNIKSNESHCCQLGKEELELYMPDEIFIQDGKLNVRTRHRTEIGPQQKVYHYTSGWIDTKNKFSQRFGKFEANCSLPSRLARGVWPAFWLLPESDLCWPTGGEVDIFEFNADPIQDKTWGSYHWGDKCGADRAPIPGRGYKPSPTAKSDWQRDWHVYSVVWTDNAINYFVDDVLYYSRNVSQVRLPTTAMYIIFDQAVDPVLFPPTKEHPGKGYDDGGVLFQVDWVRVWKTKR